MASHLPPVPPEQRNSKAPHPDAPHPETAADIRTGGEAAGRADDRFRNTAEQGRTAATKQNTTNKGYQQDR